MRQQPEVLEDHREAVAPQLAHLLGVLREDVLAVEEDLAEGRLDQPRQAPDEGRLAAAGQAHDDEHLALANVEAHVADGGGRAGLAAEIGVRELQQRVAGLELALARPEQLPQPANLQGGLPVLVRAVAARVRRGGKCGHAVLPAAVGSWALGMSAKGAVPALRESR